jgi:hypothetical protein
MEAVRSNDGNTPERVMGRSRTLSSLRVLGLLAIVLIALVISGCSLKPRVGDDFSFGSYGGYHTVWRVLEIRDGKALIITKYAIDIRDYNEGGDSTTWADCSLREWLNDSYLSTSFSEQERPAIMKTMLEDTGTEDYVFLLSPAEAEEYFPSSDSLFVSLNMTKEAEEAYAKRVGNDETYEFGYDQALKLVQDLDEHDEQPMMWLLRSSGNKRNTTYMATPYPDGIYRITDSASVAGFPPIPPPYGIRPAMWVDLESPHFLESTRFR